MRTIRAVVVVVWRWKDRADRPEGVCVCMYICMYRRADTRNHNIVLCICIIYV